jgi:oligopeptidase B
MKYFYWLIILSVFTSCTSEIDSTLQPPITPKKPKTYAIHDLKLVDNYAWLKNRKDSNVIDLLTKENNYVSEIMNSTNDFQELLYQELLGRLNETDNTVPYFKNGYWYYRSTEEGKDHPKYCRKKDLSTPSEEVIFDANKYIEKNGLL